MKQHFINSIQFKFKEIMLGILAYVCYNFIFFCFSNLFVKEKFEPNCSDFLNLVNVSQSNLLVLEGCLKYLTTKEIILLLFHFFNGG